MGHMTRIHVLKNAKNGSFYQNSHVRDFTKIGAVFLNQTSHSRRKGVVLVIQYSRENIIVESAPGQSHMGVTFIRMV